MKIASLRYGSEQTKYKQATVDLFMITQSYFVLALARLQHNVSYRFIIMLFTQSMHICFVYTKHVMGLYALSIHKHAIQVHILCIQEGCLHQSHNNVGGFLDCFQAVTVMYQVAI